MIKNTTIYLLLLSVLTIGFNSAIANNNDTIPKLDPNEEQICADLDSLLNLWHVKHSISNEDNSVNEISELLVYSDSMYVEKLGNIPSAIDLTYNAKVKSFINLYTVKRKKQVETMLGLSKYYFPIFEEVLDKYNLPLEFKYLPVIESALNPKAVSRAGATGLWQFMYSTGKHYDLHVNSFVDDRKDPIKATYAAAEFISDLYKIYGDWTLVIAAYNCGPGNVNKAIRRAGGKRNYWEIYPHLPRETRGYVPAFIAATYAMNYHKEYNIFPKNIDYPIATDTLMIEEELHFKQVSEVLNIPMEQLRELNPQYRRDIIPAKGKTYSLKLPIEFTTKFIDLQDSIFAFKDSIYFDPNKNVITPASLKSSSYVPNAPSGNMVAVHYNIKNGDNLGYISSWYNVKINDLKYWNNIRRNMIRAGQKLTIYVDKKDEAKYKKVNKMSFVQKQNMVGKTVTASATSSSKSPAKEKEVYSGEYVYYTVKSGDNFWIIAKKYPGVSNTNIMEVNNFKDPGCLRPGQKIKIKRK